MEFLDFEHLTFFATAAFSLEGLVAAELRRLGFQEAKAELGGARFTGSISDAFLACMRLRMADRVMIILAEKQCHTFEDLFQLSLSIPWEQILTTDGQYNVSGKCARSQLMSISDCQSAKKQSLKECAAGLLRPYFRKQASPFLSIFLCMRISAEFHWIFAVLH